jgi:putative lysine transport system permease protein
MAKFALLCQDIVILLNKYGPSYLKGIYNTLLLAIIATAIGCVIGLICGILQTIPHTKNDNPFKRFFLALVRVIIRVYIEVFRGTPMILQAVFIFYGLPYFSNNAVRFQSIWSVAILVVSINTGAYMAESVRGGILSIDTGQTEGAKAIGMTHFQTMTCVILPQAVRNIMPQIGNNFIINVKDTSVMFVIGFTEFFAAHQGIVGASYKFFPSAVIEMVGYLCMTLAASYLLRWVEKKMDGSSSYELAAADPLVMTAGNYRHPHHEPFGERSREFGEHRHTGPDYPDGSTKGGY